MTELLVYTPFSRAKLARTLLSAACGHLGIDIRLEQFGSGSLFQRLGPRRAPPLPDVILWKGPYAAAAAAATEGLLQAYRPARVADVALHDPNWQWTTLDVSPIAVLGWPAVGSLDDLQQTPSLALADPERSEDGLSIVLAMLDRARQVETDTERAWSWWAVRAQRRLALFGDDEAAAEAVRGERATHALTFDESAPALPGLAPLPNAVSVAANSRDVDGARRLVDWLVGEAAASLVRLSPWTAASNGLAALLAAAPPLDVAWIHQNYTATRRRWAESGFVPPANP